MTKVESEKELPNPTLSKHMYWHERKSLRVIAREFNTSCSVIWRLMNKYNIPRRNRSQANTLHPKSPFKGRATEKAYLMGLRAGDIYARQDYDHIDVSLFTTHPAMLRLFARLFSKHGKVNMYPHKSGSGIYEFGIYVTLDKSFSFLVQKHEPPPEWITNDDEVFFSFLAGYADAEGSWIIQPNRRNVNFSFVLGTYDHGILSQINSKLRSFGFKSHLYLAKEAGKMMNYGRCARPVYSITVCARRDVIRLAYILSQFSRHDEKLGKMRLMMKYENVKRWSSIEGEVRALQRLVQRDVDKCKLVAETLWKRKRSFKRARKPLLITEPTLVRNTGRGPRDTPSMRVTGRRTSKRQPKKPGVSVIGDIEGQTFD